MARARTRRKKAPRRTRTRPEPALADEWQSWLAENRLRGIDAEVLIDRLKTEGVPKRLSRHVLADLERSPAFRGAARVARRARQLTLLAKLKTELERSASAPTDLVRIATPDPRTFIDAYFATGTPVVLTDFMRDWNVIGRWTPEYLRDRFGTVEVEIVDGRNSNPFCDEQFVLHKKKAKLGEYVDRVLNAPETNDFYMIAQNRNLERTPLRSLFEDVAFPEYLDGPRAPSGSALWLGPAGTVTPLHHDTSSILFCQIHGRKRVHLVSPFEVALLDQPRGVYSSMNCEEPERFPDFAAMNVKVVDLSPGDTLFIPVGYWHHVRALDVSISLALNNFRQPNVYEWYKPGLIS